LCRTLSPFVQALTPATAAAGQSAQVYARQRSQRLKCAFAQLFRAAFSSDSRLWSAAQEPPEFVRRAGETTRRKSRLTTRLPAAEGGLAPAPFRLGFRRAQNGQKRNEGFAKRNETFRISAYNLLKSLMVLNQRFRGTVYF
jgi:hypothetical protein